MTRDELFKKPLVFMDAKCFNEISIEWIEDYAKAHNFDLDDVMLALHLNRTENNEEYIYQMKGQIDIVENISISFIQRKLSIGFHEACDLMDKLISQKIVDTRENNYRILNRFKLKEYLDIELNKK